MNGMNGKKDETPRLSLLAMLVLALPAVFIGIFATWPAHTFSDPGSMGIIVSFKKVTDKAHLCDERELAEFHAAEAKRLKRRAAQSGRFISGIQ